MSWQLEGQLAFSTTGKHIESNHWVVFIDNCRDHAGFLLKLPIKTLRAVNANPINPFSLRGKHGQSTRVLLRWKPKQLVGWRLAAALHRASPIDLEGMASRMPQGAVLKQLQVPHMRPMTGNTGWWAMENPRAYIEASKFSRVTRLLKNGSNTCFQWASRSIRHRLLHYGFYTAFQESERG